MRSAIIGAITGAITGAAVFFGVDTAERAMSTGVSYVRECLPGDECKLTIHPKDQPWLNIVCELSQPPRCRDE
jgi:hypothetical protein